MAQGMIRIRCRVCRKAGLKEKDCKSHTERTYQAIFVMPNGKQSPATYPHHTDPNKPTARKQAENWLAEQVILYAKNPQYQKPQIIDCDKYLDQYLDRHENSGTVGAMSWTGYKSIVDTHIRPFLTGKSMSDITREMVVKIREAVANHSKETKSKVNRHLKAIFKDAKLEGLIPANPTDSLKRQKKSKKIVYEILTPQGIKDLINQTNRIHQPHTPIKPHITNLFLELYYSMPIYAGLRASEVAGLRRDLCRLEPPYRIQVGQKIRYFNYKREEEYARRHKQDGITVHGRWWMGRGPEGLKSEAAYRTIPIPKFLAHKLQTFFIEQPENPHNLVFATKDGEPVDHRVMCRIHYRRDRKAAGLPTIKYHELRHTYCSLLIKDGLSRRVVDLKKIQKWMGHDEKDIKVTWGIYNQIVEDESDDSAVIESFASYIDGNGTNPVSTPCQYNMVKQEI